MLPREDPAWQSVYSYFQQWRDDGTWQRIHDTLRAQVPQKAGRHKHPTAGALDSQSVKTTPTPGVHGDDAGKKVHGRKRQILVDTLGLLLAVVVTSAALSWLTQSRRLGKDYERLPVSSEAMISIAMTRLMLRRLAAS